MGTGTMKRNVLILGFLLSIMCSSIVFAAEAPNDSTAIAAAHKTETFRHLGYAAANKDYTAAKPFFTGLLAGAMAITPAYFIATSDDLAGTKGFLIGIPGFVLPVWGGGKLANRYKATVPDRFMADFTEGERRDFTEGYQRKIKEKRFHSYASGILVGIVAAVIYFERH